MVKQGKDAASAAAAAGVKKSGMKQNSKEEKKKIADPANLTASQEEIPPPGLPAKTATEQAEATSSEGKWWQQDEVRVKYQQANPHRQGSGAAERYEAYKVATTIGEAKLLGATTVDMKTDRTKRYLLVMQVDVDCEETMAAATAMGKPGKMTTGERSPLMEIEENETDGRELEVGAKNVKAHDDNDETKKRGGMLQEELGAAAAGDTGEGAAQELAELEGVKLDDDMAGGAADQVVVASGGTKMEEVSATGSTVTMVSTEVLAAMLKQQLGPVTAVLQGMRGEMTAVKTAINENQAKITEVGGKVGRLETDLGATAASAGVGTEVRRDEDERRWQ